MNKLKKKSNGRWSIGGVEVTSGDTIEVKVAGYWVTTSIEFSGGEYYATRNGVRLYEGMPARCPP